MENLAADILTGVMFGLSITYLSASYFSVFFVIHDSGRRRNPHGFEFALEI